VAVLFTILLLVVSLSTIGSTSVAFSAREYASPDKIAIHKLAIQVAPFYPQDAAEFGYSVAVSKSLIVVGEPYFQLEENGKEYANAGVVCLYSVITASSLTCFWSPNYQSGGEFGYSVAVDSKYIVVGAPGETSGQGNLYLYKAQSPYNFITAVPLPNLNDNANYGFSVAISGSIVITGAPFANLNNNSAGMYCISQNGEQIYCAGSGKYLTDGDFGYSVAMSGQAVAVGAPGENSGQGTVYYWNTPETTYRVTSPHTKNGGGFGSSVAINSNYVAVGAPYESAGCGYQDSGDAYVFNLTNPSSYEMGCSPFNGAESGFSVGLSGTNFLFGAPFANLGTYTEAGLVYVHNILSGKTTSLMSGAIQDDGLFGASIATSGKYVVVGAPYESSGSVSNCGNAYEFT
jgi:hypothetical protein